MPERARVAVLGLFAAWIAVFAQATFLVALQEDLTLISSSTAVAATLNVIGPGLGQVGASENFEAVNSFGRVVLTGCMLLGRLEIFTALVLLSLSYVIATDLPGGLLIYGSGADMITHDIQSARKRLEVVSLNLFAPPAQILRSTEKIAELVRTLRINPSRHPDNPNGSKHDADPSFLQEIKGGNNML